MPLIHSSSKSAFKKNVSALMGEVGKSPHVKSRQQALAIAFETQRRGKAEGGPTFNQRWEDRIRFTPTPEYPQAPGRFEPELRRPVRLAADGGVVPPFTVGSYNTNLAPIDEFRFRKWVADNGVPFDPNAPVSDYDMRGFWRAQQQGNPMARTAINPNDNQVHYPDYWKTPLHQSFSSESQWADQNTPRWINDRQLANQSGRIVFDETAAQSFGKSDGGRIPYYAKTKTRTMARGGGLHSPIPGRTDKLPLDVPAGSYVLPSDVVSGLGQGNTAAGIKTLDLMFKSGPYGMSQAKLPRPRQVLPRPMRFANPGSPMKAIGPTHSTSVGMRRPSLPFGSRYASGGSVPIAAAGGEYLVSPEQVSAIGAGNIDHGHAILDEFVNQVRADTVRTLQGLPGPAR